MSRLNRLSASLIAVGLVAAHLLSRTWPDHAANPLNLLESLYSIALALVILLVCAALGWRLLRLVHLDSILSERENFTFGVVVGLVALGYVLWGISLIGYFTPPVLLGTLLVLAIVVRKELVASAHVLTSLHPPRFRLAPESVAIAVLLLALLGISLLKALAPPTDYDSLMYHLTVPARFLQEGRYVSWLANVPQSAFPFSLEMVFGLGMALGNDSVPALLSFGMVLLICLAIHDFAGKYIAPEPAGSFAAVAFLTSTYFVQAAGYASVDPLWVLAEFLAVYAFVAWTKHRDAAWLRLTGVLLGAGLAV